MAASSSRPNILFIMADDHASKAISCYGAGINHTPHLDRLAAEGMRFNHCYVNNSICTPSRAAILTGTHSHVNLVRSLSASIDNRLPNVAKQLRSGGYQTAMIGKWHLGEGKAHEPRGFDHWTVIPDQGEYWDPHFITPSGTERVDGYVTDIITDKTIEFIEKRDQSKPFFAMCHHKAPHRSWECDEKHKHLYGDYMIKVPENFSDDYKHRARAARVATMRVAEDLTYFDLGLIQVDGGRHKVGEKMTDFFSVVDRKIPAPEDVTRMRLVDKETLEIFTFKTPAELAEFKYQRYMQRYLRTIQSIDDNIGRILAYLSTAGLAESTVVIYTSDQGFFLGEHGWFDKRFMYEESFQMPFLIRYPSLIKPGTVCEDIISNVDFASTFCELAGVRIPSYMQGHSFLSLLQGSTPKDWQQVAYHRYWMHNEPTHHAYAHYGCRDQRWKLIFWYNEPLDVEGAEPGGEVKEWELFDCVEDPLELFNVYHEEGYKAERERMKALLREKMLEIGDEVVHDEGHGEEREVKRKGSWFWSGGVGLMGGS